MVQRLCVLKVVVARREFILTLRVINLRADRVAVEEKVRAEAIDADTEELESLRLDLRAVRAGEFHETTIGAHARIGPSAVSVGRPTLKAEIGEGAAKQ